MSEKEGATRRQVMAVAGALGAAAVAGVACSPSERDSDALPDDESGAGVTSFELEEATVADLGRQMAAGERTSREITRLYLDRIEALDRRGPTLRSVIETNPDALEIAEQLDRERAAGSVRGPLHGIPILLKDNIATADRHDDDRWARWRSRGRSRRGTPSSRPSSGARARCCSARRI